MQADQPAPKPGHASAPTWIRSTRPDGHRSLWWHETPGRRWTGWIVVERVESIDEADGDDMRRHVFIRDWNPNSLYGGQMFYRVWLQLCEERKIPTPTPEDLAWLRGAG